MPRDWAVLHDNLDTLIRQGKGGEAQLILEKLQDEKIPREWVARFALVARRADRPQFGLRVLNPIVRADRKLPMQATPEEKAEYAQCLIRLGASEEASLLLEGLSVKKLPQVLLYRASAHLTRWEYAEALPLLKFYVKAKGLTPYQRLVGKVNLATTLDEVGTQRKSAPLLKQATYLFRELFHETSLRGNALLQGSLLSGATWHFAKRKKWKEVQDCLKRAQTLLKHSHGDVEFMIRKWRALTAVMRAPQAEKSQSMLAELRREATQTGHWETVRQCDEIEGVFLGNKELLTHLYFGTPYEKVRARLVQNFESPKELPQSYLWRPDGGPNAGLIIDLLSGEAGKPKARLKPGQLLHRLLTALTSDFYRPIRLASVHFRLYPGEYFNPVTSPFRVYEAVKRLRAWLDENNIGLAVDENNGAYRLAGSKAAIRIYREVQASQKHAAQLLRLHSQIGSAPFSIGEAAKALEMPSRSVQRLLESAVQEGHIVRTGQSRATRYHFSTPEKAATRAA